MQIQFWGTRGSIPKPGPGTVRYGGNTLCVEVRSPRGALIIIDGGTGLHGLGTKLLSSGQKLAGHVLISHTHWDHIQGIPFFAPFFVPGNEWRIYGPKGLNRSIRETLAGQMQYTYFPITPNDFGSTIHYGDLLEGVFEIEDVKITTQYLNHPALTLGYRLESESGVFVYCCDHEPFSPDLAIGNGDFTGLDQRHLEFVRNADLLVHDAQYTAAEYPAKVGWGHSSIEFVVRLSESAGVKHVALAHHDPLRTDDALDVIVSQLGKEQRSRLLISAAAEGQMIELRAENERVAAHAQSNFNATTSLPRAMNGSPYVLIMVADSIDAALLSDAVRAEGLRPIFSLDAIGGTETTGQKSLSLAIFDLSDANQVLVSRLREESGNDLPIVVLTDRQTVNQTDADVLIKPISSSFARTKIRAWVLREACRWMRAPLPPDEPARLASLRDLRVLDTEPEERFDRITRMATSLFNVPMATITFVDDDRQWFKSCQGTKAKQDPRDVSFCAHVVYDAKPLIVTDTLNDDRFADNPLVLGEPRIRFYAGYPLVLQDGACIGTLCLLDSRPRDFSDAAIRQLRDLAIMTMEQLRA